MAVYSTKTNRTKSRNIMLKLGWSLIGIFSVLLLLVAFNFFDIISIIILGSIGLVFYPLCIFFIVMGIMLVLGKPIKCTKSIVILSICWLCVFVLIMQMITSKEIDIGFASYMTTTFKENLTAGGVLFGVLLYPFYYLTHTVATYVILSCILVIISAFLIDRIRLFIIARNTFEVNDNSSETKTIDSDINDEEDDELALESEYVPSKSNNLIDDDVFIEDEEDDSLEDDIKDDAMRKLGLRPEKRTIQDLEKVAEQSNLETEENSSIVNSNNNLYANNTHSSNFGSKQNNKPNIIIHEDDLGFNVNQFVFENKTSDKVVNQKTEQEIKEEERKKAALEFINISKGKFQTTKNLPKGIDNVGEEKKVSTQNQVTSSTSSSANSSSISSSPASNNFNQPSSRPTNNYNTSNNSTYQNANSSAVRVQPNKPASALENGFTKITNIQSHLNSTTTEQDLYDENLTKKSFEDNLNSGTQSITIPSYLQSQTKFVPEKAKKEYSGEVNDKIVEPEKNSHHQISIDDPIVSKPKPVRIPKPYKRPPLDLLTKYDAQVNVDHDLLNANAESIVTTLKNFKIDTKVLDIIQGPTFTSYEMQMLPGISVNSIFSKENDLKMVLRNKIRLQVPIPGKNAFGIEVPNAKRTMVGLRDILESSEFQNSTSPLTVALGKDISNTCKIHQIDKMVHTLVAGGTNSGKSVCLHTLLVSLLYKASPDELKLILVDPKMVELAFYNDLPHMLIPKAITELDKAIKALEWLVEEMERRYRKLQSIYAKNIIAYNNSQEVKSGQLEKMYYIVMVFDEVGDFMTQAKKEIEDNVKRLAAKARACGIHLILTTQRPTTDVITGTIKTNLPSRIAFAVTSFIDSKTILECAGAESLLGKGDMLFLPQGAPEPERMQCAFVDDDDLIKVLKYVKENNEAYFDETIEDEMFNKKDGFDSSNSAEETYDALLKDSIKLIIKTNRPSAGYIQSYFSIGWPRANKIMAQLEKAGYISTPDSKSKRKIFMTAQEFEEKFGESIED